MGKGGRGGVCVGHRVGRRLPLSNKNAWGSILLLAWKMLERVQWCSASRCEGSGSGAQCWEGVTCSVLPRPME